MTTSGADRGGRGPQSYEICLQGHLDARWADRLPGMTFAHGRDGATTLTGPVVDQAALHGLLAQIRDLGLPIISIQRLGPAGEAEGHGNSTNIQEATS